MANFLAKAAGILGIGKAPRTAGSNFALRTSLAEVAAAQPEAAPKITRELAAMPYVKATGELPVTFPTVKPTGTDRADRVITSSPLDDYFWTLPQKLPPKQIESILRMSAGGSIWQQYQLNRRMEESWPMYRKCVLELKRSVAGAKYVAQPYTLPGKRPTPSAMEKADLVNRGISQGFHPDRFADEDDINGMVFDLCEALPMGISIVEMIWNENAVDPAGNNESMVRATAWVNPRNYTFTPDGRIGVANIAETGYQGFSNAVRPGEVYSNPDKFIVASVCLKRSALE